MVNLKNKKREFMVFIEEDEDGVLISSVPSLKGCHSQAKDLSLLLERTKEAISLCLETETLPPSRLKFVGVQEIAV